MDGAAPHFSTVQQSLNAQWKCRGGLISWPTHSLNFGPLHLI